MLSAQAFASTSNSDCPDISFVELPAGDNFRKSSDSDGSSSSPPIKKVARSLTYKSLPRNQCPSVCLVCRNWAAGYHYDVPSCNGCKTFFRRTILTGRKFVCLKIGKCIPNGTEPIDTSKRLCRACRFEKCVQVGMNPLAIQAEVKSDEGKELREEVLNKRPVNGEELVVKKFTSFQESMYQIIEDLVRVESKVEPFQKQGLPPGFRDLRTLDEILKSSPIFSTNDIPNLVYAPPKICKNTGERKKRHTGYLHTGFLSIIEYSKTFDYSNQIDFSSRKALLQYSTAMCAILMNSFFSFHHLKSDKLLHPDGTVAGPPQRKLIKYGGVFTTHKEKIQYTLIALLRNNIDKTEYLLLKAITLCNPAVGGLSLKAQQIIEKNRMKFVQCLFSYCMIQHGSLNGPSRFSSLISIISVLENQQKYQKDFHILCKAFHHNKHKNLPDPCEKKISLLFDEIMAA